MTETLSSYRIFYEVAKAGNISKAASTLFISQPAISKSIQKLEDSLETKLFIRSSKGVLLTPEGELLFDHARIAFESLDLAEEQLKQMVHLGVGSIKIGVSTTLCKYLLLPYLQEFIKAYPHIGISISCQSTNKTLSLLEENKIDIGLIGRPEHIRDIQFYFLDEIEDIFVATDSYLNNLMERGVSRQSLLENSTLMLLDKNNMTRQYIDDYLSHNKIHVKDAIEISNMDLLIEFAKIGVGVACVIRNFVTDELTSGRLTEISLDIPIHKRQVGFAYKESHLQNPALIKFIDFYEHFQVS